MFKAKIKINEDSELINAIQQILKTEKEFKTSRAKYSLRKLNQTLTITITSKDATAFRAVMSSITTQISMIEKTWKKLKKE